MWVDQQVANCCLKRPWEWDPHVCFKRMCQSPLMFVATALPFPSAWHRLVLSLLSIAITCVLKAVITTLCYIATLPSLPLYFSQFRQACGCLSAEAYSSVILFCCLTPWLLCHCILATVKDSIISASKNIAILTAQHRIAQLNKQAWSNLKTSYTVYIGGRDLQAFLIKICLFVWCWCGQFLILFIQSL